MGENCIHFAFWDIDSGDGYSNVDAFTVNSGSGKASAAQP